MAVAVSSPASGASRASRIAAATVGCTGSARCPMPVTRTFTASRSGWSTHAVSTVVASVQLAPEAHEPGPAAGGGGAQLLDHGGTAAHLTHDGVNARPGGDGGAPVRGSERHQGAHPSVTAESLYVVPGDQAAEAVSDDVDPAVPGARADFLHMEPEQLGGGPDVACQRRVVERFQMAMAVPGQRASQDDERGTVVDEAVQQDDGWRVVGGERQGGGRVGGRLAAGGGREGAPPRVVGVRGAVSPPSGPWVSVFAGRVGRGCGGRRSGVRPKGYAIRWPTRTASSSAVAPSSADDIRGPGRRGSGGRRGRSFTAGLLHWRTGRRLPVPVCPHGVSARGSRGR